MKFRLFLAVVCLCFVAASLLYGTRSLNKISKIEPTATPAPAVLASLPESDRCDAQDIQFEDRPLTVGFVGRPTSLLPFSEGPRSDLDNQLAGLLYRGLIRFDENGNPLPDLASWGVSDDGLTVTFTLDQGGRWHDGTPVTAADVVFTVGLLSTGQAIVPGNFPWSQVSASIVDEATVAFSLPIPFVPFLEAATVGILPSHLGISESDLAESPFAQRPVGSGPFKILNQWESDGFLLLEPVQASYLSNLVVHFYADQDALSADLTAHELDLAVYLPNTSIAAIGTFEADRLNIISAPIDQSTQLFFRMDSDEGESIADPAVRRALRLITDRQLIVDAAANGQGILTEGPWTSANRYQEIAELRFVKPDLDLATNILNEAGWAIPEESPNRFQKDGVELSINLVTSTQGNYPQIATELAKQWQAFGIGVSVESLPYSAYQTAVANREFDATVQKVQLTHDPDLYDFWSQEAVVRGQNLSKWNHRPSSEALEAGRQVWNDELRAPYYKAFSTFFENELPAFTLYQDVRLMAMNGDVRGQMDGSPADLEELVAPFSQWVILADDYEERCGES